MKFSKIYSSGSSGTATTLDSLPIEINVGLDPVKVEKIEFNMNTEIGDSVLASQASMFYKQDPSNLNNVYLIFLYLYNTDSDEYVSDIKFAGVESENVVVRYYIFRTTFGSLDSELIVSGERAIGDKKYSRMLWDIDIVFKDKIMLVSYDTHSCDSLYAFWDLDHRPGTMSGFSVGSYNAKDKPLSDSFVTLIVDLESKTVTQVLNNTRNETLDKSSNTHRVLGKRLSSNVFMFNDKKYLFVGTRCFTTTSGKKDSLYFYNITDNVLKLIEDKDLSNLALNDTRVKIKDNKFYLSTRDPDNPLKLMYKFSFTENGEYEDVDELGDIGTNGYFLETFSGNLDDNEIAEFALKRLGGINYEITDAINIKTKEVTNSIFDLDTGVFFTLDKDIGDNLLTITKKITGAINNFTLSDPLADFSNNLTVNIGKVPDVLSADYEYSIKNIQLPQIDREYSYYIHKDDKTVEELMLSDSETGVNTITISDAIVPGSVIVAKYNNGKYNINGFRTKKLDSFIVPDNVSLTLLAKKI